LITPSDSIAIDRFIVDQDSFLPSAIQRYHQLLMPALQVVSGMLASLGPKHTTVANQVPKIVFVCADAMMLKAVYHRPWNSYRVIETPS
jgi:hypothetical protein